MTVNAQGYFNQLKTQLSDKYCVVPNASGQLVLSEKPEPESPKQTIHFTFSGTALAVKLDKVIPRAQCGAPLVRDIAQYDPELHRFKAKATSFEIPIHSKPRSFSCARPDWSVSFERYVNSTLQL